MRKERRGWKVSPQHLEHLFGQVLLHLLELLQVLVEVEVVVGRINTCAGGQEVRNVELDSVQSNPLQVAQSLLLEDKPGLLAFLLLPGSIFKTSFLVSLIPLAWIIKLV
tara:strand:- start:210 stop:536 length:327 start_codon:yes stop_codon:yes gene_type:complete